MPDIDQNLEIRFDTHEVTLVRYPFMKHNLGRTLAASRISEVVVGWAPPCVRTDDGEYLFVPENDLEALIRFASIHDIPFKKRVDIWSMILDPFLDTVLDDDYVENSTRILRENGVSDAEVEEMRALVATRMRLLTYHTFEWVYLGLFDVLDQMLPLTFTTGWAFDRFYDHAMALADRGEASEASPEEMRRFFLGDADSVF